MNEWEEIKWEIDEYGYRGRYDDSQVFHFDIRIRLDGDRFMNSTSSNSIYVYLSRKNPMPKIQDIKDEVFQELTIQKNNISSHSPSLFQAVLSSIKYFVSMGLCLSLLSICIIGIKNYLLKRKTLFRIEYAGGGIAFDVSFYAKAEIDDFQKQLRRVKDYAEETATIKTVALEAPEQSPTQSNMSDELRKYADLLKEGLITQDEYDAMKKKILEL